MPRPIKKIPKVGTDKFVIESIVEFEPEDSQGAPWFSPFSLFYGLWQYPMQRTLLV